MHLPTSPAQWASVVGLLGFAVYNATVTKDYNQAMQAALAALAVFGIGAKQASTEAKVQAIKADTRDIRNNPTMPGTPTESRY